jgi:phytoene dehydrogenase-like protein
MASGTTFLFLYHALGPAGSGIRASRFIQGGAVRLSEALADAARQYGAEICTGVAAQRILAEDGRATGVLLESGELVSAPRVVSSAGPRRTFFNLVGAEQLELRLVREVKNIKFRGSTARLNLALDGLPRFDLPAEALGGHILLSPSLKYMERAHDDAKYGGASRQPILDMTLPSLIDPSVAPPGKHLLTIDVRYAPYHLKDTDWQAEGGALVDRVIDLLEGCAPGMKSLVAARQLLTPLDLEREYGLEEGSIYHGQMGLDQLLFMRPVPGYGSYRTPLAGLYLCGAGSHPGGGLTGAPGYNAAREILK